MEKDLSIKSHLNRWVHLFFLILLTIFIFASFIRIQVNLHNTVYSEDIAVSHR